MPVYGNPCETVDIQSVKSLHRGDSCNVYSFRIQNHWGTHIDCPRHFFEHGATILDYPADFWFFHHPHLIEVSLAHDALVMTEQIRNNKIPHTTDLLLLKAQWGVVRNNPEYALHNPGIHPDVARYLRTEIPSLRALGIDWISVSPYQHKNIGRETHHAFLDPDTQGNPILLIEDMDLAYADATLTNVYVFPLRVDCIDSAPVTVIGVCND